MRQYHLSYFCGETSTAEDGSSKAFSRCYGRAGRGESGEDMSMIVHDFGTLFELNEDKRRDIKVSEGLYIDGLGYLCADLGLAR
jgi:hypothetical protein